jgi:hypothetical protein
MDDCVLTVAFSTPSTYTLAEPCDESSAVTQASALHDEQWNVADADAAVVYLAAPPHATANAVLRQVPV